MSGLVVAGILACILLVAVYLDVPLTARSRGFSWLLMQFLARSDVLRHVILSLLRAKCLPSLLYAVEACPVFTRDKCSLEFSVTRIFMKVFRFGSPVIVQECQAYFGFLPIKSQIDIRTAKFLENFVACQNSICSLFVPQAYSLLQNFHDI